MILHCTLKRSQFFWFCLPTLKFADLDSCLNLWIISLTLGRSLHASKFLKYNFRGRGEGSTTPLLSSNFHILPLCPGVDLGWYLLYPSVPMDFPRFSFRIQSLSYQHCCVRAVFVRCQCGLSLNLWNYNVKLPISLIQHFLCITYSVHCAALMFPPT